MAFGCCSLHVDLEVINFPQLICFVLNELFDIVVWVLFVSLCMIKTGDTKSSKLDNNMRDS